MCSLLGQEFRVCFSIEQIGKVRVIYLLILCWSRRLFQGLIAHSLSGGTQYTAVWLFFSWRECWSKLYSLAFGLLDPAVFSWRWPGKLCWDSACAPWRCVYCLIIVSLPHHIAFSQSIGKCESFDKLCRDWCVWSFVTVNKNCYLRVITF